LFVRLVGAVDALAGIRLDEQLVSVCSQFGDRSRSQADTIFVNLDLFWYPNAHYFVCSVRWLRGPIDGLFVSVPSDCGAGMAVLGSAVRDRGSRSRRRGCEFAVCRI